MPLWAGVGVGGRGEYTVDHHSEPAHSVLAFLIGVFHGVAGVAHATPGLMELPSTGKEIEASR